VHLFNILLSYLAERTKFISASSAVSPHLPTFLTRLWKQADDGLNPFDWSQLVAGFWGEFDSAAKAHVVAIFELAQNFRMRDEAELVVCVLPQPLPHPIFAALCALPALEFCNNMRAVTKCGPRVPSRGLRTSCTRVCEAAQSRWYAGQCTTNAETFWLTCR
jgi:hypothetical protein